ncbi:hypothetical protein, partial [Nonomuraea sp. NPDC049607]|uniref:hypothetical protein n=1 Tax=Nonomuraea sp. NPDC049607 TaxID=3154732 RepID=UPI00342662FE
EVGRSVRTVALLRFLADPALRRRITAVTNKVSRGREAVTATGARPRPGEWLGPLLPGSPGV